MSIALAVGAGWLSFQALIKGVPPGSVPWWSPLVFAALFLGFAVFVNRGFYIRVDDSTVMLSPGHRTFARRDVARIRGLSSGFYGAAAFLRPDGSALEVLPAAMWGRAGLQSLADHLGVPFDGAQKVRSYWDFGRWS